MAETRVQTGLSPTYWDDQFSVDFFQNNPFSAYAGTGSDNPIVMKEDFASKRGNGITHEFITSLDPGSIKGYQPLRGHEDKFGEFADNITWTMRKKGVSLHELDVDLAAIDLRKAARATLRQWSDEDVKFEVIARLQDVGANLNVPYDSAAAADYNTWNTNNADRISYGGAGANYSAGAHATSLGNVTSSMKLTKDKVSLLKRLALMARPRITPIRVSKADNRRFYVLFVSPLVMRDFVADLTTTEATVNLKDKNEGLFMGGDREWDGVIVHEVDDMPVLAGVGGSSANLSPVFLLGAEALGWGIKSRYSSRTQTDDYQQVTGLGMIGKWGMKKLGYVTGDSARTTFVAGSTTTTTNILGKQRGMVTGYFAASSD